MTQIPASAPRLDGDEEALLIRCIREGWISGEGPFVESFEAEFADRIGRAHGIAVSSGSAALEVAAAAIGIGPGDEVVLPSLTIISCIAPLVRAGATPVLVDSDAGTWNMLPELVEAAITPRTRAILAVHTYGLPVDLDPILQLAARHGIRVIEDAAQMHGQTYRGRLCGSFGDISTFSFYANKHVTTGEGGMLLTDDAELAQRCRSLRNLCFQQGRRFVHEELGWNYRMSSLQAAVGIAQLRRLDDTVAAKRRIGRRYSRGLQTLQHLQLPCGTTDYAENNWWAYGVVLRETAPLDAELLAQQLAARGIATRPFFWPLHEQPVFRRRGLFTDVHCPTAERLARRGLCLPSGVALTDAEIDTVAHALHELLAPQPYA